MLTNPKKENFLHPLQELPNVVSNVVKDENV
jgi:hypothetical protein